MEKGMKDKKDIFMSDLALENEKNDFIFRTSNLIL